MPRMTLAYREYSELPREVVARFGEKLTELDLSHNNFQNLGSLSGLNQLEILILDNNALASHVQFPHFPNLHTLWINHNRVENLAVFIQQLSRSFPKLRTLSMINNPAAPSYFNGGTPQDHQDYRLYVISQLPNLKILDDAKISDEERAKAKKIFGGRRI